MPSPFPGMDPWLEGSLWSSVHAQLSVEIVRQIAPRIRPRYIALIAERFVYDAPDDVAVTTTASLYPDVSVAHPEVHGASPGAESVAWDVAPLRLATAFPESIPHVSIEIRDVRERQLVCAIEVLSPTNKKKGPGRKEYTAKRRRVLRSSAHLMEIDLLRRGTRVPMTQTLPDSAYFVLVGRAQTRPIVDVWPISLGSRLPRVPVPLLEGDPAIPLDLQAAFTSVYELGYDLAVDYSRDPEVPLSAEERPVAEAILKAAGLR